MAKIFDKTDIASAKDRALILNTNEAILRKMDLPAGWTEIRLGMFISPANYLTGLNHWVNSEDSINQSLIDNSYCFGIKDESTTKLSETNSSYIGMFSAGFGGYFRSGNTSTSNGWVRTVSFAGTGYIYCAAYNNATRISYAQQGNDYLRMYQTGGASREATINFAGVSIRLQKSETATKAIVSLLRNETVTSETDVSNENMIQRIFGSPETNIGTIDTWFSGDAPTNLNSFFFKFPFPTICMCVHNYGYVVT